MIRINCKYNHYYDYDIIINRIAIIIIMKL